jgi:hypothetical protein
VIAARIRDHSAAAFFICQRSDLVVGAAQFEGADGLQVFELEEELALIRRTRPFEQGSADGDAVEKVLGLADVS